MNIPDNELVKACQNNKDLKAFELLIKRHQQKVRAVIFRFLSNPEDLDDISQEVFIKAFKSIKSYRGDSSFSTWLCCIAVNSCKDRLKALKNQNQRIVHIDDEHIYQIPDKPDTLVEKQFNLSEDQKSLFKAIKELPFNQQLAVILHDIEELSYEQIAKISNCPTGTIKSRLFNARRTLKDKLKSVLTTINVN